MRKKTENESKYKNDSATPTSKGGSKSSNSRSDANKNKKGSNLMDYKNSAPKKNSKDVKKDAKSEHEIKLQELDNKIEERKKKYDENLSKNYKIDSKKVPSSYLKDPSMAKGHSEAEKNAKLKKNISGELNNKKYVNRSALAVDPSKASNQKVIKEGIKHDEANLVINKPKKVPSTSQQDSRSAKPPPSTSNAAKNNRVRSNQQTTGSSRQAQLAAKRGSGIANRKASKNARKEIKKEIEDVYNLPDFPNQNDSSDEEGYQAPSVNKSAMQLMAEHKAKQEIKKMNTVGKSKNSEINKLNSKKMVIPPETNTLLVPGKNLTKAVSATNKDVKSDFDKSSAKKKEAFGQKKIGSSEFDDLLNGKSSGSKGSSQKKVADNEFDDLLNSSSTQKRVSTDAPSMPVEMSWKIDNNSQANQEDEEKTGEEEFSDESLEDVEAAFNFTDTEFDANNRDDYTYETEVLNEAAKGTLHAIAEVDEESEQTIQKKKCGYEIKSIEKRLAEMEITQKSKWNLCIQIAGEKAAQACYDFVCTKFDNSDDDYMEESIEEIHSFIAAHGVSEVDNMAFELFTLWNKESDIKALKEELEQVKERQQMYE